VVEPLLLDCSTNVSEILLTLTMVLLGRDLEGRPANAVEAGMKLGLAGKPANLSHSHALQETILHKQMLASSQVGLPKL
jgi:hypothetical protein